MDVGEEKLTSQGFSAENTKLDNIVTPVNADVLEKLLIESAYDKKETEFLVNGFRHGFDIGYEEPMDRADKSRNIPFREGVGSKQEL